MCEPNHFLRIVRDVVRISAISSKYQLCHRYTFVQRTGPLIDRTKRTNVEKKEAKIKNKINRRYYDRTKFKPIKTVVWFSCLISVLKRHQSKKQLLETRYAPHRHKKKNRAWDVIYCETNSKQRRWWKKQIETHFQASDFDEKIRQSNLVLVSNYLRRQPKLKRQLQFWERYENN